MSAEGGAAVLSVDIREFTRAVNEYVAQTGKDSAAVLNRKAASMFFAASKAAPRASAAALRKKAKEPKYVAFLLALSGPYTREQAKAYSAALAKRYARSVGFLRAYLRTVGRAILGRSPAQKGRGIAVDAHRAAPGKLQVYAGSSYSYLRRQSSPAPFEDLLEKFLRLGVAAETADTLRHLRERMQARAKEHSAT